MSTKSRVAIETNGVFFFKRETCMHWVSDPNLSPHLCNLYTAGTSAGDFDHFRYFAHIDSVRQRKRTLLVQAIFSAFGI